MTRGGLIELRRPAAVYVVSRLVVLFAHLAVAADTGGGLVGAVRVWDSAWYLSVVVGYSAEVPTGQSNIAFFPLYPLLARAVAVVPGIGSLDALAMVGLAAGLSATCLLWLLVRDLYDADAADRSAALFAFAPGAFVFSLLYSEGVFLTAAIAACWALIRRRYLVGGVLCALATLARPNGLALVAVAAVTAGLAVQHRREWRALVAPVLAPLGFVGYMAFTWRNTGRADSWFLAQRLGWNEHTDPSARLDEVRALVDFVTFSGAPQWNAVVAGVGLVVAVVSFVLLVRAGAPIELVVFTLAIAALALTSATLGMRPRFLLSAFPLTVALGVHLRSGAAYSAVLAGSAGAMAVLAMVTSGTMLLTP